MQRGVADCQEKGKQAEIRNNKYIMNVVKAP
jgi:hypothetical protein